MKSQDIVLLLKLVSLAIRAKGEDVAHAPRWQDWELLAPYHPTYAGSLDAYAGSQHTYAGSEQSAWEDRSESHLRARTSTQTTVDLPASDFGSDLLNAELLDSNAGRDFEKAQYSVRALAASTGISKSQISLSLQRCLEVGLAKTDRKTGVPRANIKALVEFMIYGLRYVFPAKLGEVTRGIATSLGAPVLEGKLMTAGELIPVWPDALGNTKGQAVVPLAPSVTVAVRADPLLYALLALSDAIRIGQSRERKLAADKLADLMRKAG